MKEKESIILVNPNEFGIEENKVDELIGNLPQIKEERNFLESQYNEVLKLDIEDSSTSKSARELRLKIRDNRTKGIDVWHKTTKELFLKGGQFVDAIKRKEVAINQRMEDVLEEIEKHFEIQEAKRKSELKDKRIIELQTYSEFVPFGIDLSEISDEEYQKVFNGSKLQYEAKLEAESKAEEEAKRQQENFNLHNERKDKLLSVWQFVENKDQNFGILSAAEFSKLFDFSQKSFDDHQAEQDRILKENERLEKEKLEAEAKAKLERAEAQKKLSDERAKQEEALKIEREKQAKLEAELKAKNEAEAKAERERLAEAEKKRKEAEKQAKAPVKKQLSLWVDSFEIPAVLVENEKKKLIQEKFESFKKWAKSEIDSL